MDLRRPDPEFATSRRSRRNFVLALRIAAGFVVVIWSVFVFDRLFALDLARFGLRPRDGLGLLGLFTTPLLHGSLGHLASNSVPLFVGAAAMLFLYPNCALRALPMIYVGSAALAWVFARPNVHIGASGLIYGVLAFVFVSGLLRRDLRSVGVSLLIWFLYGSMLWGILPVERGMSWELHASGLVVGIVLALVYRRYDRPPVKRYAWEVDEEFEDEFPGDGPDSGRDRWS